MNFKFGFVWLLAGIAVICVQYANSAEMAMSSIQESFKEFEDGINAEEKALIDRNNEVCARIKSGDATVEDLEFKRNFGEKMAEVEGKREKLEELTGVLKGQSKLQSLILSLLTGDSGSEDEKESKDENKSESEKEGDNSDKESEKEKIEDSTETESDKSEERKERMKRMERQEWRESRERWIRTMERPAEDEAGVGLGLGMGNRESRPVPRTQTGLDYRNYDRQGNVYESRNGGRDFEVTGRGGNVVYSKHDMGDGLSWGVM